MSEAATYDAWEEDLATLNIYFGQETVMGEPEDAISVKRTNEWTLISGQIKCWRLIFSRAWKKHKDGTSWVLLFSWWSLWSLPWLQHHLIHWGHFSSLILNRFSLTYIFSHDKGRLPMPRWFTGEWSGCAETLVADSQKNLCNSKSQLHSLWLEKKVLQIILCL